MSRSNAALTFVAVLTAACSARIVDSTAGPVVNASGGSATMPSPTASGSGIEHPVSGANSGTNPKYPRPVAVDGSSANPGASGESDAGQGPLDPTDATVAPAGHCAVPPVPAVPAAGSGAIGHCAPMTCPGIPPGVDISESWHENIPAANYAGCTTVTGSLVVAMTTNADLGELSCLERVVGDMVVWNNPGLTTLHGLESLTLVEGTLAIARFGNLSAQNESLRSVAALGALQVVGKDLVLDFALPLPDLDGFGTLTAVGGSLAFHSSPLQPTPLPKPVDVSGFGALASIGDNLAFEAVDDLVGTSGFGALSVIGGSIVVDGATDLVSLAGFPRLSCLGQSVSVIRSYLEENTALQTISFASLGRIGGSVHVEGTPNLRTIDLFGRVARLDGGTLRVLDNPSLSVMPVSALTWVGDDIVFGNNASLPVCPLLDLKARLEGAGYVHHFTLSGGLACSDGMTCLGTSCVVP